MSKNLPSPRSSLPTPDERLLTRADFHRLAEVPAEAEWFANIDNARTRRAYRSDIGEFMHMVGIERPEDFRTVSRSHVLMWRKQLEERAVQGSTIRRKLAALSSLFEYLCVTDRPYGATDDRRNGATGSGLKRVLSGASD